MSRSLLSILNDEQALLDKIDADNRAIFFITQNRERILGIPIDCQGKTADLEANYIYEEEYRKDIKIHEQQLFAVRKELREYLKALFS